MIDDELHQQLYLHKDRLLERLQNALEEAGLKDFDIASIGLYARRAPKRNCPPGTTPVWEPVRLADGTIVYQWICK